MLIDVLGPSFACEACTVAGNMGLQMALCGAVGGIVIVKLVAQDLLARLPGNHRDEGANSDAEWTDEDESDWMLQGTSSKETAQMRRE